MDSKGAMKNRMAQVRVSGAAPWELHSLPTRISPLSLSSLTTTWRQVNTPHFTYLTEVEGNIKRKPHNVLLSLLRQ